MGNGKKTAFQAEVLTHLKYIRQKQDNHDKTFDKVFSKLEEQDKRIDVLHLDVENTKSFAKGAAWVGAGGGMLGVFAFLNKLRTFLF